jgi:hypothetical protein
VKKLTSDVERGSELLSCVGEGGTCLRCLWRSRLGGISINCGIEVHQNLDSNENVFGQSL